MHFLLLLAHIAYAEKGHILCTDQVDCSWHGVAVGLKGSCLCSCQPGWVGARCQTALHDVCPGYVHLTGAWEDWIETDLKIPGSNLVEQRAALTFEIYFRFSAVTPARKQRIFDNGGAGAGSDSAAGHNEVFVFISEDYRVGASRWVEEYHGSVLSDPLETNMWHHIAAVWATDGTTRLYVNGGLVGESTCGDDDPSCHSAHSDWWPVSIGTFRAQQQSTSVKQNLHADISYVRLWSVARDHADILKHMDCSAIIADADQRDLLAAFGGSTPLSAAGEQHHGGSGANANLTWLSSGYAPCVATLRGGATWVASPPPNPTDCLEFHTDFRGGDLVDPKWTKYDPDPDFDGEYCFRDAVWLEDGTFEEKCKTLCGEAQYCSFDRVYGGCQKSSSCDVTATDSARRLYTVWKNNKLPVEDNIALRRAAVSSALQPRCIGSLCVASNAFDDDIASRWVGHLPAADSSAWLEVDLEYEQPISHMRIDFEDASSDIYEISTSSDNITWTVINLGSDNEVDRLDRRQRHEEVDAAGSEKYRRNAGVLVQRHRVDTFDFPTINARFARFRHIASPISSSSSDSADSGGVSTVSIWEWSIFSGDIVVSDLSASVQPDGWRHYRGAQVFGNELATFPRESMDVVQSKVWCTQHRRCAGFEYGANVIKMLIAMDDNLQKRTSDPLQGLYIPPKADMTFSWRKMEGFASPCAADIIGSACLADETARFGCQTPPGATARHECAWPNVRMAKRKCAAWDQCHAIACVNEARLGGRRAGVNAGWCFARGQLRAQEDARYTTWWDQESLPVIKHLTGTVGQDEWTFYNGARVTVGSGTPIVKVPRITLPTQAAKSWCASNEGCAAIQLTPDEISLWANISTLAFTQIVDPATTENGIFVTPMPSCPSIIGTWKTLVLDGGEESQSLQIDQNGCDVIFMTAAGDVGKGTIQLHGTVAAGTYKGRVVWSRTNGDGTESSWIGVIFVKDYDSIEIFAKFSESVNELHTLVRDRTTTWELHSVGRADSTREFCTGGEYKMESSGGSGGMSEDECKIACAVSNFCMYEALGKTCHIATTCNQVLAMKRADFHIYKNSAPGHPLWVVEDPNPKLDGEHCAGDDVGTLLGEQVPQEACQLLCGFSAYCSWGVSRESGAVDDLGVCRASNSCRTTVESTLLTFQIWMRRSVVRVYTRRQHKGFWPNVATPADCRDFCSVTPGCQYWTWRAHGGCWLKHSDQGRRNMVWISGPRESCDPLNPMDDTCFEIDTDYVGWDLGTRKNPTHQNNSIPDPFKCQAWCQTHEECKYWSWRNPSVCYIKSWNRGRAKAFFVSGARKCRAKWHQGVLLAQQKDESCEPVEWVMQSKSGPIVLKCPCSYAKYLNAEDGGRWSCCLGTCPAGNEWSDNEDTCGAYSGDFDAPMDPSWTCFPEKDSAPIHLQDLANRTIIGATFQLGSEEMAKLGVEFIDDAAAGVMNAIPSDMRGLVHARVALTFRFESSLVFPTIYTTPRVHAIMEAALTSTVCGDDSLCRVKVLDEAEITTPRNGGGRRRRRLATTLHFRMIRELQRENWIQLSSQHANNAPGSENEVNMASSFTEHSLQQLTKSTFGVELMDGVLNTMMNQSTGACTR